MPNEPHPYWVKFEGDRRLEYINVSTHGDRFTFSWKHRDEQASPRQFSFTLSREQAEQIVDLFSRWIAYEKANPFDPRPFDERAA